MTFFAILSFKTPHCHLKHTITDVKIQARYSSIRTWPWYLFHLIRKSGNALNLHSGKEKRKINGEKIIHHNGFKPHGFFIKNIEIWQD